MSTERDSQDKYAEGRGQESLTSRSLAWHGGAAHDAEAASHREWCQQQRVQFIAQPMPTVADLSDGGGAVHAAAQRGVAGAGQALPHADKIQASFGHHDISHVKAHVGGDAAVASAEMGAEAYATGNQVAFKDQPSLHVAAHEAAHVVQQRGGVSLKGGVGTAGDHYEQQADAVADAVVAGQSAAPLLSAASTQTGSPAVQRQAAQSLDVDVSWSSPFGADFTGSVTLRGKSGKSWSDIEVKQVTAATSVTFSNVPYFPEYEAFLNPADDVVKKHPNAQEQAQGQFKNTSLKSGPVAAGTTNTSIRGGLELNRWNHDNVEQRHASRGLDPAKTAPSQLQRLPLFGRHVEVHHLLAPRVAQTEALFQALPPTVQDEISKSIFVMGGYAYRNQVGKGGAFSDHSIGTAIDVNYNEGVMQNALMETAPEKELLTNLVQPVVQTDPAHAAFDIWNDKGQDQLEASHIFVERFPWVLADLLNRGDYTAMLQAAEMTLSPDAVRAMTTAQLMKEITPDMLDAALKAMPAGARQTQLQLIKDNWKSMKAWVLGAGVVDAHAGEKDPTDPKHKRKMPKEKKVAHGMIPLDARVLQLFLDAGWNWGGDWKTRKDYMHFEDSSIEALLKI